MSYCCVKVGLIELYPWEARVGDPEGLSRVGEACCLVMLGTTKRLRWEFLHFGFAEVNSLLETSSPMDSVFVVCYLFHLLDNAALSFSHIILPRGPRAVWLVVLDLQYSVYLGALVV